MPHPVRAQSNGIVSILLVVLAAASFGASSPAPAPRLTRQEPADYWHLWGILQQLLNAAFSRLNQTDAPAGVESVPELIDAVVAAYTTNGPPQPTSPEERADILQTLESTSDLILYYQDSLDPQSVAGIKAVIVDAYQALGGSVADLNN